MRWDKRRRRNSSKAHAGSYLSCAFKPVRFGSMTCIWRLQPDQKHHVIQAVTDVVAWNVANQTVYKRTG